MLAVVEKEPVVPDRRREPTEHRAALEGHDLGSAVRGCEGGTDPCEPAPDHHHSRPAHSHTPAPARARTATQSFSEGGSDTRVRVTAMGSRSIRSSRRW